MRHSIDRRQHVRAGAPEPERLDKRFFGGSPSPPAVPPAPPPPPITPEDVPAPVAETADDVDENAQAARRRRRRGLASTILTDSGDLGQAPVSRPTLLGS